MKRIKVLHIFKNMNRGGAETFIMNVFNNIDRNKVQFDFLCFEENGNYFEDIKKLGGNIFIIDKPLKKLWFKNIKDIVKIIKKNEGYDVIHIPLMFYSGVVCFAAYIANVKKRIVHSHNANESQKQTLSRKIYHFISRFLINIFSTNKIACGEKARDFLFGKTKKNKKETIILKNGINLNRFSNVDNKKVKELKMEFEILEDEIIIGNVARFSEQKNHMFFINLGTFLKNNNFKFKIILVGDGELKKEFEKKIKQNNLEKYFILTGIRKDIPELLNLFDVFLMPSLYEGFPVSIVESIAANTPCLISNTISQEVQIVKGMVFFLDLEDNLEIWVENIIKLKNIKYPKKIIISELIKKGFSIENSSKILEEIYLESDRCLEC